MNLEDLLKISVSQLEKFLTTKTVVGEPIIVGDVTLVPIQTVSFGYGTGGGESGDGQGKGASGAGGTGGGGGAGANLRPIAIVAVKGTDVQVYTLGKKGVADNIASLIPDVLSKIMTGVCKKGQKDQKDQKDQKCDAESCQKEEKE